MVMRRQADSIHVVSYRHPVSRDHYCRRIGNGVRAQQRKEPRTTNHPIITEHEASILIEKRESSKVIAESAKFFRRGCKQSKEQEGMVIVTVQWHRFN